MHGFIMVNKVAGNFHFAPGKSYQQGNVHVHEFNPNKNQNLRFSHTIHELSFGDIVGFTNPLDGVSKKSDSSTYDSSGINPRHVYISIFPQGCWNEYPVLEWIYRQVEPVFCD
jgi:hypothetical protein